MKKAAIPATALAAAMCIAPLAAIADAYTSASYVQEGLVAQ